MGAVGSFSEQAGEHYRNQEGLFDSMIVPLVTADAVLAALAEKTIDKAKKERNNILSQDGKLNQVSK